MIQVQKVSKEMFDRYEAVRVSGVTNMFAVGLVSELSGLEREDIFDIMKNYSDYKAKYSK